MNKELSLLHLLKENEDGISATSLACHLNVSTRTIRNYIKKINELLDEKVVFSTNKGYFLNEELFYKVRFLLEDTALKTPEERVTYLISTIIRQEQGINIYVLLDELDVSENTINSDLIKVESYLKKNQLRLMKKRRIISIEGSEQQKRKLIRKIYSEEAKDQVYYFFSHQDILTDQQVESLRNLILNKLTKYKIEMNDFSLSNVLLHLIIAITRIRENQPIVATQDAIMTEDSVEYCVAKEIFNEIQKKFKILENNEEIEALKLLLIGNTRKTDSKSLVNSDTQTLTHFIMEEVNRVYLIDLDNEGFFLRFSLHLDNLLKRRRNNVVNPSPMLEILQRSHPMIYDVGLFIGGLIESKTNFKIPEEEIAFISLHIGSCVNEKNEQDLITASIICPNYNGMNEQIIEKLNQFFKDKISIKSIVVSYAQANEILNSELVISTIPYNSLPEQEVIFLTPIFSLNDIKRIEKVITKIELKKKISFYQTLASKIFNEDFFFINQHQESKEEYIDFLGRKLVEKKIISTSYIQSVFEREKMSPTLFGQVAIPHSLYRTANKSVFAVLINDEPIKWGKNVADIIFFMTLDHKEQESFNDFLQLLIRILSEKDYLKRIIKTKNYFSFLENLQLLIQEYLESE